VGDLVTRVLLSLVLVSGVIGCEGGTPPPAGGLGPVVPEVDIPGATEPPPGGGGGSVCGTAQGSCLQGGGVICAEYGGIPADVLASIMSSCAEVGSWSNSGCNRSGTIGGCHVSEGTMCAVVWFYDVAVADAMTECATNGGTWVNP
jgi:hypothetical protein